MPPPMSAQKTGRVSRRRKPATRARKRLTRPQLRRMLREYSDAELGRMLQQAQQGLTARDVTRVSGKPMRAGFDAAQTNDENRRHWAGADALNADAAASPFVRSVLRQRARYEVANNSYGKGLLLTLANDTIGRGPRLQLLAADDEDDDAPKLTPAERRRIEKSWQNWFRQVKGAAKLRLMRIAKCEDGETFAVKSTNEALKHKVKLDFRLIEADQVATPDEWRVGSDPNAIDGIRFDEWRNPIEYHVLKDHPGTDKHNANPLEYVRVPAGQVIHWFRQDRPGQSRGIPEITPALPLFGALRRFTLAVLGCAETAAEIAGVVYTDSQAVDPASLTAFDTLEINPREFMFMPEGWKIAQMKGEQPTTTYGMFKGEILGEIGRCVLSPYNVTAGKSAEYNYASGRLDFQAYDIAIGVEREDCETTVLDELLAEWLREAVLIEGLLPQSMRNIGALDELPPHRWFWDGRPHVDPEKESRAQAGFLANNTTTLADECAKDGKDWEDVLEQRGRELARMKELGIPVAAAHDNTGRPMT
jgi:lambda family phage portal protein